MPPTGPEPSDDAAKPATPTSSPNVTRPGLPNTKKRGPDVRTAVLGSGVEPGIPTTGPSPIPTSPTKRVRRPDSRGVASTHPANLAHAPTSVSQGDADAGPGATLADRLGIPSLQAPVALLSLPGERPFDSAHAHRHGQYLVGDLLGEGGMGRVVAARELDLGRTVAMKTLRPVHRDKDGFVQALVFEARLTGQLEHPNIVPVYEIGTLSDGTPYYTMKLVGELSLKDVLRQLRDKNAFALRQYTLARLLQYLRGICMAVEYAHARGVIHRDLKPDNVLIGDYGEVQIMDWGVARVLPHDGRPSFFAGREEEPGVIVGTPHYMSPEQARGDTYLVDARSDVYSLGIILYQLLTHALPYDTTTTTEQLDALLAQPIPAPSVRAPDREIPAELERICLRATARDRASRYPSARALWDDIDRFLQGRQEAERLAELATAQVLVAGAAAERYYRISRELLALEVDVRRGDREDTPLDPIPERRARLEQGLRADRQRLVEARAFAEAVIGYQRALAYQPDHADAARRLAALYQSRAALSRDRGDDAGYVLYGDLARATTLGQPSRLGSLSVRSYPEGAVIRIYELDGDAGPLDEDAANALIAPVGDLALKPGSYLISATMPMYRETRQPVVIQPGENEHLLVVLTPWGMSVPMAARGDELVAIRAAFDSTVSNKRVGSMMVEGGPGLGKAKLLNDFGIFLDGLTDLVAYGVIRCTSLHPMVPFHAVSDFVRHRAGIAFDDQADVIRTKLRDAVRRVYEHNGDVSLAERGEIEMVTRRLASLPSLCGRASNPVAAERAMDGGDYALLVLDAMVSYLRQIAKRIPIVLVIRGADQLDRLSRDLLFYVATQLHDDNLFCLMFSRTDRLQLRCEQVITLEPLARDRIQRQLELLLRATVDSDVVEVITRLSAGNAFYVSELARLLSRRGWLTRAGRHRSFTLEGRSQNFDLATIRALLTDEIEGLSATAREVLQTASVSGDVFWAEQVGRHLGRLIDEELRELAERELIMPTASRFPGTLAYVFRHTDARKMLASSLEATRRQGGHRALAKWVASMATGRLIDVAFEAKHLTLAGDSEAGDVRREILAKVAAGWERDDAPSWFAWPEDLSSGLLDDIG